MIQEFTTNVQRLFAEIVTDRQPKNSHDADELLSVLQRKVTLPVRVIKKDKRICMVYDNVTIELRHDLSAMQIVYNSDYQMTFNKLSSCDVHQLSEFILSLERDIPKWRYIWIAQNILCKKKLHVHEQVKHAMHEIEAKLLSVQEAVSISTIEQCRLRYYNLKTSLLMLEIGNPFWKNKATEQDIFEECRLYHIDPPMELWCEEFAQILDECNKIRDEKIRKIEEKKRQVEKVNHLIALKQRQLQAIIKTIELHPGFRVEVHRYIPLYLSYKAFPARTGLEIHFIINEDVVPIDFFAGKTTTFLPKIIDAIQRINDIIPDLNRTLNNAWRIPFYSVTDNRYAAQICKIIEKLHYN